MALNFRPRAALYGLPDIIPSGTAPGETSVPSVAPATIADAAAGTPVVPRHPSFFGQGGVGRNIAGAIGDAFLQMGHAQPIYAPAMEERSKILLAQKLADAKRAADRQDFVFEQQYKQDHPINDTANDYAFWQSKLTPDQFNQYIEHKVNPPLYRQGPDGQFYPVAPPPTAPVGKLTPLDASPTIHNTPAPALGTNGLPPKLTAAEYQAIVASKGQAATDAWLAQHPEIQVGGQ